MRKYCFLLLIIPSLVFGVDQYDVIGRLSAGTGGAESIGLADLTEEGTPTAGDFLFGWEAGGALRKFDIGDIPSAGDITAVGDCATGAAFTGACGTTLTSNTSVILALDDDANGSESFSILDGADASVFSVTEAGAVAIAASGSLSFGAVAILSDIAGTTTLSNVDAIDATTETTLETAIDSLTNLTVVGTIGTGTWQGTAIADTYVADDITASNYLPLAGGTLTGELVADDLGIEFTPGDTLTDCSTFSATGGGIFYDDSEGKFKKCQDNALTDLDTGGAEVNALESDGASGIADTEVFIGTGAGTGNYAALSGDVTMSNTGAVTIAADAVEEGMLKSVNAATDEYCLTYEATVGDFEWQACAGGVSQLSDLSDVGVTTPTNRNALMADGDSWESRAIVEADISDLGSYLTAETNALESDGASGIADTEIPIGTGAGTVNYAALSGDVTMTNTGAVTIAADAVEESMLKSVNAATDEYCLTYESTTGDFEWQTCGAGGGTEYIIWRISNDFTPLTAGTDDLGCFHLSAGFTLTGVYASLNTVGTTSGTTTIDINEAGTTVLSTKLTIDATEATSATAATAAVISDSSLAANAQMCVQIDVVSGGATEAGLVVTLTGTR